jgi:hypothetical protein
MLYVTGLQLGPGENWQPVDGSEAWVPGGIQVCAGHQGEDFVRNQVSVLLRRNDPMPDAAPRWVDAAAHVAVLLDLWTSPSRGLLDGPNGGDYIQAAQAAVKRVRDLVMQERQKQAQPETTARLKTSDNRLSGAPANREGAETDFPPSGPLS